LTQTSTKETLTGIITQIQNEELTQPQELMKNGRENSRKDNDGMKTGDEFEKMTPVHKPVEGLLPINNWRPKNGTIFTTSNMPPNTE